MMRRLALPTLACLALLLASGTAAAHTAPGDAPVLDPEHTVQWIAGDTAARESVPDLDNSGLPYGAIVSIGGSGGRATGSHMEGLSPAGALVSSAAYVVVRRTAVLEEKVREARRALDQ